MVVAVVFSDLHLSLYSKFNQGNKRTDNHFKVLFLINQLCLKYKCSALFCGDLFHKPEMMENGFLEQTMDRMINLNNGGFNIYAISGNHDMSDKNTLNSHSPSYIKTFSRVFKFIKCIDYTSAILKKSFVIHGVPYLDHNIGLNEYVKSLELEEGKKHILMLHTDYPGAKDTDGQEVGTVENLNLNTLSRFDLVLCGHIHKPQRLSKKVYMIGAPLQQRRTDKDCELGYWLLYDNLKMEFVPFTEFPKFIDVEDESEIKDDGNYYTVIGKSKTIEEVSSHKITKDLSKKRLVSRYFRSKGIKDDKKKKALLNVLKTVEND